MSSQPINSTMAPKVNCLVCSKPYSVGYLKKHMKKEHSDPAEDLEVGRQEEVNVNMWVENEKEMSFATRDLDSFLNNKSDLEILNAAAKAERLYEAEQQMIVREQEMNQCLEWYDEDHNDAFNFTSDFAEEVRKEAVEPTNSLVDQNRRAIKQKQKEDDLVKHTTRLLKQADIQKSHLRKTIISLEQELADTLKSWEMSEKSNREELSKVNEKLAAVIKESKKPEVTEVDQKCDKCKFICKDSKIMKSHIAYVHSRQDCHLCAETFTSKAALRNHVKKHLNNELQYTCGVCNKNYKNIEDAKEHAMQVCGSIVEKGGSSETESPDILHSCKACNATFNRKSSLDKHSKENHESVDCNKCNTTFKSQSDVYSHANRCSEVIDPLMCDICNSELISKAGLKKHMEKCKKDKNERKEKCKNGQSCQYHKENRCNFEHDKTGEETWTKVQHKRQGRQQKQSSNQKQQQQQKPRQKTPHNEHIKDECRNGPSCIFLKHNRCNYGHKQSRHDRQGFSKQNSTGAQKLSGPSSNLRPCKFGNKCSQGMKCTFLHLPKDFLPQQGGGRS